MTTYAPLETAAGAVAAAISVTWPTLAPLGTTSEATVDISEARDLLNLAVQYRKDYEAAANYYTTISGQNAAATSAYNVALNGDGAGVIGYNADYPVKWTALDKSVRGAETDLVALGAPGSWTPAVATTPTNDRTAITTRVNTAIAAANAYSSMAGVVLALTAGLAALPVAPIAPTLQALPPLPESSSSDMMTAINALIDKLNKFAVYLTSY